MIKIYNDEFLTNLVNQATKESKYKPVLHHKLGVGDFVLLKEKFTKAIDYPMGTVKEVVKNELGEITGAFVWKGRTKELVKRHVNSLIYLFSPSHDALVSDDVTSEPIANVQERPRRRVAQITCKKKISALAEW